MISHTISHTMASVLGRMGIQIAGCTDKHRSETSGTSVRRSVDSCDGFHVGGVRGSSWLANETIGIEMSSETSLLHDLSGPSPYQLVHR